MDAGGAVRGASGIAGTDANAAAAAAAAAAGVRRLEPTTPPTLLLRLR